MRIAVRLLGTDNDGVRHRSAAAATCLTFNECQVEDVRRLYLKFDTSMRMGKLQALTLCNVAPVALMAAR